MATRRKTVCLIIFCVWFLGHGIVSAADLLTSSERAWLDTHPEIKVAVLPDYPPISFLDAQGQPIGLEQDYLRILESRLNIHFKKVIPSLTQRAANEPEKKQIDVLILFAATKEREQYWLFSKPYLDFPVYLITQDNAAINVSLASVEQVRVSVVGHYAAHDFLKEHYPQLHIDRVDDTCLGMQHVAFGASAGLLTDLPVANWCAEHFGLKNLKIAQSTEFHYQLALAVRKDWSPLLGILEKGLASISPAERDVMNARWNKNAFEKSVFDTYRNLILMVVVVLLSLLIYRLMQWDDQLKRALNKRVNYEAIGGVGPQATTINTDAVMHANTIVFSGVVLILLVALLFINQYFAKVHSVLFNGIVLALFSIALLGGFLFGRVRSRNEADNYLTQLLNQTAEKRAFQQKFSSSEERLALQQAALGRLAQRQLQAWSNPDEMFREIAEVSAQTLDIERVSVWLFSEDREQLECISLYLKSKALHTIARPLQAKAFPTYFEQLGRHRIIAADDAMQHEATVEFAKIYLLPNHIGALLDGTIWLNNQVIGVICHEHVGSVREWTLDEQSFAGSIADLARLTIETHRRGLAEQALKKYSEELEQMVAARTLSLRESEQCLSYVIDHAPISILTINNDSGEIVQFNPEAEKATGYRPEAAVGKTFIDLLVAQSSRKTILNMAARLRKKDEVRDVEVILSHADGRQIEFLLSACLIVDRTGVGAGQMVAIGQDISQQKRLQVSLVKARESAESADRIKSMFVASMSHELRTPLNSIIGFLGVVLHGMSGEVNDKQKDQLGRAFKSAKHLLALISDVIDISKIEAGYLNVYIEPFELKPVLTECTQVVHHLAQEKHLSVTLDCPEGIILSSDRKRLYQAILNVMSNAVKYTEAGFVKVSAHVEQDHLYITTEDSGIGIDEAGLVKLFTPFERAESHLKIKTLGTGLGLYLTRNILTQLLGGDITVKSTVGEGSIFTIVIPMVLPPQMPNTISSIL